MSTVRFFPPWLAAVLVLGFGATLAAAAESRRGFVSWADGAHQHGWATVGGPRLNSDKGPPGPRCRDTPQTRGAVQYLCATEDGGRSWHRILRVGDGLVFLSDFTRTSTRAGVASLSPDNPLPR